MQRTAYVLLTLTAIMWAGNAVAGKLAVGHISPMALNASRWLIALCILLPLGGAQLRRDWPVLRRHLPFLLVLGVVGFTVFNVALYNALLFTSAINASIEQAAIPMVIFIASFLVFSTRVTWAQLAGFLISVVGVAVTASHGDLWRLAALDVNFGDALMILAVLAYGGYTVALRRKPAVHWQSLMIVMVAGAAASSLVFLALEAGAGGMILPDMRGWAVALYTALFPSIVSQVFYMRGVELIGANRAGLFINLVPVFGVMLSVVLLGEAFHAYHAVALLLVMGGIWLAEEGGRKRTE